MNSPTSLSRGMVLPVILAGGSGSRLWPLSREDHPKPFIQMMDGQSLIQKTFLRATAIDGVQEVLTVTNRDLFFQTKDEFEKLEGNTCFQSFILEPFGRNSSAAIGLAAHYARAKYGEDCLLLVLPADHLIEDLDAFKRAVAQAVALAQTGRLVTFGISPDSPKTGFGYIEAEGTTVLRFVEKPDAQTAQTYLDAGNYYWNAGMFCMAAGAILREMETNCEEIAAQTAVCLAQAEKAEGRGWSQMRVLAANFEPVQNISIDYAVFEKSNKVSVVPCSIGWSDIGSWLEFGELAPGDQNGNHVSGSAILEDVHNSIVYSQDRVVAAVGLQDIVIADTADALLVACKDRVQDVRLIVKHLKDQSHSCYKSFPTVRRPWGNYTVLLEGAGYKLKKIEVKPHESLSLQSHKHRNEHWVVVCGKARVTNGDRIVTLGGNDAVYIPAGNKHRLENIGEDLLVLMEVQCGTYTGEDDIVRYDDHYGRQVVSA